MRPAIFPKEIILFSLESHYSRFSRHSRIIYLLIVGMAMALLAALQGIVNNERLRVLGRVRFQLHPHRKICVHTLFSGILSKSEQAKVKGSTRSVEWVDVNGDRTINKAVYRDREIKKIKIR